jgi:epoxyqueuosine reductase
MELSQAIKNKALDLGFCAVGITTADPIDPAHSQALTQWIERKYDADLNYMRKNLQKRIHPALYLENARSIVCVAFHYKPPRLPPSKAQVANFALYDDYHPFIKERLLRLAEFIQSRLPLNFQWHYKAAVDTAPLAERALAQRAGLGFIGKNHMLIHPTLGSQLLLGQLVTTLDLTPDQPLKTDGCRTCDLCLRACPTGALSPDGFFLAHRCISYLTQYADDFAGLEHKVGRRLFGCDTCLLACPYEHSAPACQKPDLGFHLQRAGLNPDEILQWNQDQFDQFFKNSCVETIGLGKLKKNARICADNQEKTRTGEEEM